MDKIKKYVERFFKSKPEDRNYSLTTEDVFALFKEIQSADGNGLFLMRLFPFSGMATQRAIVQHRLK